MGGLEDVTGPTVAKLLVSGGLAGMCAKTTVAPLDRIKILLQAQSVHYRDENVVTGLRKIVKSENLLALYKGNGAQMDEHILKFVSGSMAGVTAASCTFPLDTIRARLAFQVEGERRYRGILHTGVTIVRQEGGLRGLYRGLLPTVLGMVPYAGLSFYCFEVFKYLTVTHMPAMCNRSDSGGLILKVPAKLVCGGLAGATAQTFSYPLDVARRRMQLAMMLPDTHKFADSMLNTLRIIYTEDGVFRGLYRGLSINYLRAIPMTAVSFSVYELMKQFLGLDTSVKVSLG